jgi:hypothetical protein
MSSLKKFGYFLSISQQAVSAHIIQIQLWTHHPLPPPYRVYSLSRYFGRKVQLGAANRGGKLGLVWRNRKKISQIINAYLCLPFFLLIVLW